MTQTNTWTPGVEGQWLAGTDTRKLFSLSAIDANDGRWWCNRMSWGGHVVHERLLQHTVRTDRETLEATARQISAALVQDLFSRSKLNLRDTLSRLGKHYPLVTLSTFSWHLCCFTQRQLRSKMSRSVTLLFCFPQPVHLLQQLLVL